MTKNEIKVFQSIFGNHFIGPEQVNKLLFKMKMPKIDEDAIPDMNYSMDLLREKAKDYLLILGYAGSKDNPLDIIRFRNIFGVDPEKQEPCFYNQDWYLQEEFVNETLDTRWYLVKKDVFEDSRAVMPKDLLLQDLTFPSAILCVFAFYAYYFSYDDYLWYHDFVWCSNLDHNGDRIYVGKYHDIDGINKNGFSIHRHLALRKCYAAVDSI